MYVARWILALIMALAGAGLGIVAWFISPHQAVLSAGAGAGLLVVALIVPPIGGPRPEFRVLGLALAALCLVRCLVAAQYLSR